ncbi:MAG: tRNA pseudouridine synthase B [Dehalococcoidia bacterium]|nr:tRNA pseudouridine synthase B [Bacillota bacterium]
MDGIINVLKPPGMTSHDVVNLVRRLTGMRRVGHTGTLDPGAAGVLPICIGKATRVSEYVLRMDKSYRAELSLGQATDTEDAAGQPVLTKPVPALTPHGVELVLKGFLGKGSQIPPMYSAVRVDGERLYELARRGEVVERKPREIQIYNINLLAIRENFILFELDCSRGTYVRTLCRNIAEKLGSTGHMSFLLRTAVGPFLLGNAVTFEELAQFAETGCITKALLPMDTALANIQAVTVDDIQAARLRNGMPITLGFKTSDGELFRVYDSSQTLLAIAAADSERIKPIRVFI